MDDGRRARHRWWLLGALTRAGDAADEQVGERLRHVAGREAAADLQPEIGVVVHAEPGQRSQPRIDVTELSGVDPSLDDGLHASLVLASPHAELVGPLARQRRELVQEDPDVVRVAMDDVEYSAALSTSVSITNTGSGRNPEAHHEDRELRNLIREAVSRLGEKAGAMFALRYFEGFDNGEIAQIMGTSPLVVGVTLHRARARLRKDIGDYLQKHPKAQG